MILAIYLSLDQLCYISICIVGFIFVFVFSPIENKRKPIPLHRRPKIKIISAIIYLIISILGMVVHFKFETLSNAVLGSLVSVVAVSMRKWSNFKDAYMAFIRKRVIGA